jgi:hypothetical protein
MKAFLAGVALSAVFARNYEVHSFLAAMSVRDTDEATRHFDIRLREFREASGHGTKSWTAIPTTASFEAWKVLSSGVILVEVYLALRARVLSRLPG